MPVFDSASKPSPAEAALLHRILHPTRSGATFRWPLFATPRQRRAQLVRALVVVTLLGGVCGSALIVNRNAMVSQIAAEDSPASTGSLSGAQR
jgi:hypothetical protein